MTLARYRKEISRQVGWHLPVDLVERINREAKDRDVRPGLIAEEALEQFFETPRRRRKPAPATPA